MDEKISLREEAEKIVDELFREFNKEEIRLKLLHDNNSSKIEELEENILQLTRNEDIDYRFFSPRNIVSTNKEKIDGLREEKADLEKSSKSVFKQMTYYKEKADKLEQLKLLLEKVWDEEELQTECETGTEEDAKKMNVGVAAIKENADGDVIKDKDVIKDNENGNIVKNSINERSKKSIIEVSLPSDLKTINHKLELCSKFIDNDPVRTKVELKSIIRNLDDMIVSIQ